MAAASRSQLVYFEPGDLFENPQTRPATVRTLLHLGVRAIRLVVVFRDVAPAPKRDRPPPRPLADPATYRLGRIEEEVAEAVRLHWQVLLTVTGPVPNWASADHQALVSPLPAYFERFMEALGKRFGKEVGLYAIWNEPNQVGWLQPQFNANGTPASPALYRALFFAGYRGLQRAGLKAPKVLFGETAPFGPSRVDAAREGTFHNLSPLAFLRGVLCLNSRYQPVGRCAPLPAAGYAHHAYTNSEGPGYVPPNPDEVTIGTLGRLVRALNLAAAAHLVAPNLPIYLTEFGINTRPNPLGVSPYLQAVEDASAEKIAWETGRVAAFSQYELRDDRIPRRHPKGWIGFQTGLFYANGVPKPLYYAWALPLVVREEGSRYYIWGHVRPAAGPVTALLLIQRRRGAPFHRLARVRTGPFGYFVLRSGVRGRFWKVRWNSPQGTRYEGLPMPPTGGNGV